MNNLENYRNSVNKIEINEDLVKSTIDMSKNYTKRSKFMSKNRVKIGMFGRAIITAVTLFSASAASYAGYTAITGKDPMQIFPKKSNVLLEGNINTIETQEINGIENNGVRYKIDIPSEFVTSKDGETDLFKLELKDEHGNKIETPEVFIKVNIIDSNEAEKKTKEIINEIKKYIRFDYESVESYTDEIKIGKNEIDAKQYSINKGMQWDSALSRYYVIKINEEKFMIIEQTYYREAIEGWGDVMSQLVTESLEILSVD